MEKITKKRCIKEVGGGGVAILINTTVFATVGTVLFWLKYRDIFGLIFLIAVLAAMIGAFAFALHKKLKSMAKSDFYIVEDIFINVQEKYALTNKLLSFKQGKKYDYDIKFSHSGIHSISILAKVFKPKPA